MNTFLENHLTIFEKLSKQWILTALLFALILCLAWTPMDSLLGANYANHSVLAQENVDSFSREIGNALINGVDIVKRIRNVSFYSFFYLPSLILICWVLLSLTFYKHELRETEQLFLNRIVISAIPSAMMTIFLRLDDSFFVGLHSAAYSSIFFLLVYLRFGTKKMPLEEFKSAFFCSFAIFFVNIRMLIMLFPQLVSSRILSVMLAAFSYALSYVFLRCYRWVATSLFKVSEFRRVCAPFFFVPCLTSLWLEAVNILARHEIYIARPIDAVWFIMLGAFLGSIVLCLRTEKGVRNDPDNKWQYFLLIVGIVMLAYQPPRQIIASQELFERSNAGSDVYALLTAGEIPLVDNFNAHMILEEADAILYGLLNGDAIGAIWFSYPFLAVITYIVLFQFLSLISDTEYSTILFLFFPVSSVYWLLQPYGLAFCLLPLIAALLAMRGKTALQAFLFACSCAISCLFRADVGSTATCAAVIVLTVVFLVNREQKTVLKFLIIGLFVAISLAGVYSLLCLFRGVSPVTRLMEALSILSSNIGWSYTQLSQKYDALFFFCYFFIPTGCMTCFILAVVQVYRKKISQFEFAVLALLALTYFLNYSRGIVRHSLFEGFTAYTLGYGALCIMLFLWMRWKSDTSWLSAFLCGTIVLQLICGASFDIEGSLLQKSVNQQLHTNAFNPIGEKIERVILPPELKQIYEPLKTIFDATLDPEQSYIDYSNSTVLYALTDRNKPVYVNQSPGLLNKEFDHLLFLREAEKVDCPYVLSIVSGGGFDGIENNIKHYLTAEYINRNYQPLCIIGSYLLWARQSEYALRFNQINALVAEGKVEVTFWEPERSDLFRSYNLELLPWLWANYDKAPAQEVLAKLDSSDVGSDAGPQIVPLSEDSLEYSVPRAFFPIGSKDPSLAVWCSTVDGQDDLIWYPLQDEDPDMLHAIIHLVDHKNQRGRYEFHLYCTDEQGARVICSIGWIQSANEYGDTLLFEQSEDKCGSSFLYDLNPANYDRSDGNYLEIVAVSDTECKLVAGLENSKNGNTSSFAFRVLPGENRYLIRVSGDWNWYADTISFLRLTSTSPLKIVSVSVLRGDIDYDSMNFIQRYVLDKESRTAS